jgi:hypothetical protein
MDSPAALVAKLAHPISEVRARAVHSLATKVDSPLLFVTEALLHEREQMAHSLISLVPLSKPRVQFEALAIIQKLSQHEIFSTCLRQVDAIATLQFVRQENGSAVDSIASMAAQIAHQLLEHLTGSSWKAEERSPPPQPPPHLVNKPAKPLSTASRSLDFATVPPVLCDASKEDTSSPHREARLSWAALAHPPWVTLPTAALDRLDEQALFEARRPCLKRITCPRVRLRT